MEFEGIIFIALGSLVLVIAMIVICFLLRQKPIDTKLYLAESNVSNRKKKSSRRAKLRKESISASRDCTSLSKTPTMMLPSPYPSPINGSRPELQTPVGIPIAFPVAGSQTDNESTDSSEYTHPYYDNLVILMCTPVFFLLRLESTV